jgi:hypothetical protein
VQIRRQFVAPGARRLARRRRRRAVRRAARRGYGIRMNPRTLAIALAGGAAAAASLALPLRGLKRRRDRRTQAEPETYSCECGQLYRVYGRGRHRVYWPADGPERGPVLSARCLACDRPLPRGQAAPAATATL